MRTPLRATHAPLSLCVLACLGLVAGATGSAAQAPEPFPTGASVTEVEILGTPLHLYTYKPADWSGEEFVLLFHGASRTAERYRDGASGMAERYRTLVVVPLFDAERFPSRRYQFGGVLREDGSLADAPERTFAYVPELVSHIRTRERTPEATYQILGFSAGAQFLSRMAMFMDTDAERLVVMSPGSVPFPTRELEYGLGFGGLPEAWSDDERIRRYLALPITVSIGTADTELAQLPTGDAYAQGVHRYSRALHWFVTAMDLAYERQWDFNWRLVVFDGPGHSPPAMFNHEAIGDALYGHRR